MKVCRRCLYSNLHPLGIIIDDHGICSGCRVHEEKNRLDWPKRWKLLEKLVDKYRCRSGKNYDCIVPVSGARDSFFILHTVKKRLGLNPLLVTYNKHYNTAVGVRNLCRLRTKFDCDIITQVVDPDRVKRITRETFRRWGSIYWHCLAGQTSFPAQVAVKMKIPLIIWGHHQGLDQVGMFSHQDEVEMTRRHRRNHDLFRQEADALVSDHDFIKQADVSPYYYPQDEEIAAVGIRGVYLGNYIRWDTKAQHESMIDLYDYEAVPQTRTFDTYNDVDCWLHSDLHDYIKWVKWGYGRATDHAIRELRFERFSRNEAVKVAKKYESIDPTSIEKFLEWIGITRNGFEFILNQHKKMDIWAFRNKKWEYSEKWSQAHKIAFENQENGKKKSKAPLFRVRKSKLVSDQDKNFILIGKGTYENPKEQKPINPLK
jgi:N-acetyl sugar amidotransferase